MSNGAASVLQREGGRRDRHTHHSCEQSRAGTRTGSFVVVEAASTTVHVAVSVIWEHEPKPSSHERTTSPVSSLNRIVIREKTVIDGTIKIVVHALRGKVAGHLLGSVCGHMHARVGLGWGTRHGVWVGTRRVSWTDEDVGFIEGGGFECHT
jgi:hypothetical protein